MRGPGMSRYRARPTAAVHICACFLAKEQCYIDVTIPESVAPAAVRCPTGSALTAMATATQALPNSSTVRKAGFALALVYLFITYSRVIEVLIPSLRITALVFAAVLGLAVVSGGFTQALSHRIGRFLTAYVFWLVLATPFSMWRGGSVEALMEVARNVPVFFFIGGMAADFEDSRKAIHTLGYGILTLSILTFFFGDLMDGRLMLSSGKFANPNDLAQALLLALPFWWLMATKSGMSPVRRLAAFPAFAVIVFVISRTGSRSALISAGAAGLVFMLRVSFANKMKLAALAAAGACLAMVAVPSDMRSRFLTLFEADQPGETAREEGGPSLEKALGSTEGRLGLLRASIQVTLHHPLLGAGPATFQIAEKDLAEEQGRRGNWHETHNAYTQVSSEAGIPALIFFVGVLVLSIRTSHRIHKQCGSDARLLPLAHTALALEVALAAYGVSSLFSSVAYGNLLPTLAGLAVALERSAAVAAGRLQQAPASAAGVPGPYTRRFRRPSLRVQARQ